MYFWSVVGNPSMWKAVLNYIKIFDCVGVGALNSALFKDRLCVSNIWMWLKTFFHCIKICLYYFEWKERELLFTQIATVENILGYKYALLKGKRQKIKITGGLGRLDDRGFFFLNRFLMSHINFSILFAIKNFFSPSLPLFLPSFFLSALPPSLPF